MILKMKRIFAFILCLIIALSFVACSPKEEAKPAVREQYSALSCQDFVNLVKEQGYTTVENADKSLVQFERAFSVADEKGFTLSFFELKDIETSYAFYNKLLQSHEVYLSEFSEHMRYNNYGYYMLKDKSSTIYFAFVDNTFIFSISKAQKEEDVEVVRNTLVEMIKHIDYPIGDFPAA